MKTKNTIKKFLNFKFELKNVITEEDPDNFIFIGYGSTFNNIDRGNDIIMPGAFRESLSKITPKLLWQHDHSEPLGIFTEIFEDAKGLYIKGKMPKADTFVSERVIPQMKIGSINSMSIGFNIDEEVEERIGDTTIRQIRKLTLWEVSLVTIPMNAEATIEDVKSLSPFQHFKKLEKIEQSEQSLVPFIEGMEHIKDISNFLKDFGFSNSETTTFISTVKRISRNEDSSRNEQDALANILKSLNECNKQGEELKWQIKIKT